MEFDIQGVLYRASTRARDKGKFVSVPKIMSLQEWIEYYTQYGNKRPLYELFKSQVILGHDAKRVDIRGLIAMLNTNAKKQNYLAVQLPTK